MNTTLEHKPQRLASLDILRGFDLFLLVFFQPVFVSLAHKLDLPFLNTILIQFQHEAWEGFHLWDIIMPLFLFMTGAAMPFSFTKYQQSKNKGGIYRRILKRTIILFILGAVVQGNLLALDPKHIYLYTNTLQAIGVGYLFAAIIQLHLTTKWQIISTVLILLTYTVAITTGGDLTPQGNLAEKIDRIVLGPFRDGASWNEDGTWSFSPYYHYTWVLSSLTFTVTVMLGAFAGKIIKAGKDNQKKVVIKLLMYGLSLVLISLIWSLQIPIIKPIWTCSMTLFSGGICFLLLAIFYYWIDYKKNTYGFNWLKIYGMNSISAYLLGEVVNFRSVAASVSYGLEQFMGSYYVVWLTFLNYLIVFLILRIMYKQKVFLKI